MISPIEQLKSAIAPLRDRILNHKLYHEINDINDLRIFMKYHVYAVWDFMSLLKSLQNNLTCTTTPWFPVGNADTRYLINEIVVGEESDIDLEGKRKSHFELYLDAMHQSGVDTKEIHQFIQTLKVTGNLQEAYTSAQTPSAAQQFVNYTFEIVNSNCDYLQAAVFTFGREDLIPGMFMSIIQEINNDFPDNVSIYKYYIERHIEVDGGHHSHLALQMTNNLCGTDPVKWEQALQAVKTSLERRILLWDGAYNELMVKNKKAAY